MRILAILALAAALVGCGRGSDDAAPVTSGPTATGASTPPQAQAAQSQAATPVDQAQARSAAAGRK